MARWTHEHEPPGTGCPVCTRFIYLILIGPSLVILILAVLYTFIRG
jgi:hypothetical protein